MTGALFEVRDLSTEFRVRGAWHPAVRGVSFDVEQNETLALVGESGCGKSVTVMSVMRLLPESGARIASGAAVFEGHDLLALPEAEVRRLRGDRLAMIFQEPATALNPVLPVGFQVAEPLVQHRGLDRRAAMAEAVRLLDRVGIPAAGLRARDYPHEFSGGMRQRVMIAMALACAPAVLFADEPTTALDVTIQAQVLGLLDDLRRERGMGMVLITHSLGVVAAVAHRVAVMYAGAIVEEAPVEALFAHPVHPYTEGLLASIPRADRARTRPRPIEGSVPALDAMPRGCRFAPRCPFAERICAEREPPLVAVGGPGHRARCWVRTDAGAGA